MNVVNHEILSHMSRGNSENSPGVGEKQGEKLFSFLKETSFETFEIDFMHLPNFQVMICSTLLQCSEGFF